MPKLKSSELFFISNKKVGEPFKLVPNEIRFHDYINAADLVVTKGGYSTLSECLAYGAKIMIVKERNHPETQENAELLKKENRAFVCEFEDFVKDPEKYILEAIDSKIDCRPLENFGQKQACEILLQA